MKRARLNRTFLAASLVTLATALSVSLPACSNVKQVLGFGTGNEDQKDKAEVIDRADPNEYILVKNPRYTPVGGPGIGPLEPEYIWVQRKDAPFNVNAAIRGEKAVEGSPQDEARFASTMPPEAVNAPRPDERFFVPPDQLAQPKKAQPAPPQKVAAARTPDPATLLNPVYGYVVYVKGKQVYTDLTAENGLATGNNLIIYREGEELKHPVTGAVLGRAEDEIGRARIVEVGDKTSVAEITEVKEGEEIHAKDKVKLIRAN